MVNDLTYSSYNFKKWRFKEIDLSKLADEKRVRSLYQSACEELKTNNSVYNLESLMFRKICNTAFSRHFKANRIENREEKIAFIKTHSAKTIAVEELKQLGIASRMQLFNVIQTLMLEDLGIQTVKKAGKKVVEAGWNEGIERQTRKPSVALQKLITEAQDRVEAAGLDRKDCYLVVKELDNIAFKKYRGDNYHNQLKRMGINRTSDYLAYVEYVLERG